MYEFSSEILDHVIITTNSDDELFLWVRSLSDNTHTRCWMEYSQALYYNYDTGDIVDRDYTPVKLPKRNLLHSQLEAGKCKIIK